MMIFLIIIYVLSCIIEYISQDLTSTQYEELNDGTYWFFVLCPFLNTLLAYEFIYNKIKNN